LVDPQLCVQPKERPKPAALARSYFSRKCYSAPMPHAIFFYCGFAIHGTNDISCLGGPASHGRVRLHPAHAAALFGSVSRSGVGNTRTEICQDVCATNVLTAR
jgi:lipoprotein-anchoring transpeptidase ErfK/SrfK